jgi:hypothetical protein
VNVEWALLGTAATQQVDGTLAILSAGANSFGSVPREAIPAANQQMIGPGSAGLPIQLVIVARITANRSELSTPHRLDVTVMDADGSPLVKTAQPLVLNNDPNAPPGWPIMGNLIMNIGLAVYRKYGEHSVNIAIDNDLKKTVLFRIVPLPQFPMQFPPQLPT